MFSIYDPKHVSRILYQSMLEAASRGEKRTILFSRKLNRSKRAIHALVWTARGYPDPIKIFQQLFRIVPNRIGRNPTRIHFNFEIRSGVAQRLVNHQMMIPLRIKIPNDCDRDCLFHGFTVTQLRFQTKDQLILVNTGTDLGRSILDQSMNVVTF